MHHKFWAAEMDPATPALNIHGHWPDDALREVENFINHALLQNHEVIKIIHGHGAGVLKNALANRLKTAPHVAAFQDSNVSHESGAVTYILLT